MSRSSLSLMLILVLSLAVGCGTSSTPGTSGGGSTDSSVSLTGAATFYNGATSAAKTSMEFETREAPHRDAKKSPAQSRSLPATAGWNISPNQLTVTIPEIDFITSSGGNVSALATTCTATYDSSKPSATQLGTCALTLASGTYVGVAITYNTTFQAVVNDTTNNIYSDPTQSSLLNTTAPSGGAQSVNVGFGGSGSAGTTNGSTTYFPTPQTFSATSTPTISIFIDPTHWLQTTFNGTLFSQTLSWTGGASIYANIGGAGKALLISDAGTTGNIHPMQGFNDFKIFYSDATTPAAVASTFKSCTTSGSVFSGAWNSAPQTTCTSASGCYGAGGYLGLDSSSNLSWAFPSDGTFTSYAAVMSMPIPTTVGNTTTLSYVCSDTAPAPAGGATTYTTMPTLSSLGTVVTTQLTLLTD